MSTGCKADSQSDTASQFGLGSGRGRRIHRREYARRLLDQVIFSVVVVLPGHNFLKHPQRSHPGTDAFHGTQLFDLELRQNKFEFSEFCFEILMLRF